MKRSFFILVSVGMLGSVCQARPVTSERASVWRPMTDVSINRQQTTAQGQHPATQPGVIRPTTQVPVNRPSTTVSVSWPQTTAQVVRPVTNTEVNHPTTAVEDIHPHTTVQVLHPQTPTLEEIQAAAQPNATVGRKTSAQVTTSMSNYQPKQAKEFTAENKAAPVGGGSMNLGNATADQAAKDAAAKASLLGAQNNQNMDINPNQNKLGGIDKLVTDRSKWKEKQK